MTGANSRILAMFLLPTLFIGYLAICAGATSTNPSSPQALLGITVPKNVVEYVPISLTSHYVNNGNTITYQQFVKVNSDNYSSYEASNLQNVEFFYNNGTIATAWIESNASSTSGSTVYWVKLLNVLPENNAIEINLGFLKKSSNNFKNQSVLGEAPELSSKYGEYDNGAKVFNFYTNFKGKSLSKSIWNTKPLINYKANLSSDSVVVDNGLTEELSSKADGNTVIMHLYTKSTYTPGILDAYVSNEVTALTGNYLGSWSLAYDTLKPRTGANTLYGYASSVYYAELVGRIYPYGLIENESVFGGTVNGTSVGGNCTFYTPGPSGSSLPDIISPGVFSLLWSPYYAAVEAYVDYVSPCGQGGIQGLVTNNPSSYIDLAFITNSTAKFSTTYTWVRIRDIPPESRATGFPTMPSVTFGNAIKV